MAGKRKSSKQSNRQSKQSFTGSELIVLELQEIHSAETQLSRVLPRLAKAVESETLREMIEERLTEGETLIADVEAALEELEATPGRKKNVAAEGLINDAREHVQEIEAGPALDTVLIGAIQKTEHYCIAAWGTVRALAQANGLTDAVTAMERALKEGKAYDERLTQLAETEVTPALLALESEDESDSEDSEESEVESGARRSRKGSGSERRVQS
jgi:ferritin-like metal-binding protein YciE